MYRTVSSRLYGSMKTRPAVADRTIAWKPCGVQSSRTVAAGSSSPCPAHVRISGNFAASSGAMTWVSAIAKRATLPSGMGSAMTAGLLRAASVPSCGALKATACRTLRSSATSR